MLGALYIIIKKRFMQFRENQRSEGSILRRIRKLSFIRTFPFIFRVGLNWV
jgi:hypothetical protein